MLKKVSRYFKRRKAILIKILQLLKEDYQGWKHEEDFVYRKNDSVIIVTPGLLFYRISVNTRIYLFCSLFKGVHEMIKILYGYEDDVSSKYWESRLFY
jgi:hypothetical protein